MNRSARTPALAALAAFTIAIATASCVQSSADEAVFAIERGTMPPGGGLTAAEQSAIVNWASCGTPQ